MTQTACDASDVIYVPTDNTVAANTAHRGQHLPARRASRSSPVRKASAKGCGVATLSISYYDLGVTTGKMAAKILKGEANISEMPIEYAENFTPEVQPRGLRGAGRDGPRRLIRRWTWNKIRIFQKAFLTFPKGQLASSRPFECVL